MVTTNLQIRVDQSLKAEAEKLFSDIGIDMPTAIRMFLKQSLIHNGIPFPLARDPFFSSENQDHLEKVIDDLNQERNCTVQEMIEE